jgi:hypothetical protein
LRGPAADRPALVRAALAGPPNGQPVRPHGSHDGAARDHWACAIAPPFGAKSGPAALSQLPGRASRSGRSLWRIGRCRQALLE